MKALIIHPFGLGDAVFSLALAEALHREGCQVSYLCNERTVELLRLVPIIQNLHVFNRDEYRALMRRNPVAWTKYWTALVSTIRKEKYDLCFDLSMGREYAFWAMLAGISKRYGLNYKNRSFFLTSSIKVTSFESRSVREYFLDTLRLWKPSWNGKVEYPALRENVMTSSVSRKTIVIAPGGGLTWGANANYKQWNPIKFAETAKFLHQKTGLPIVFMGSAEESPLCSEVHRLSEVNDAVVVAGASLEDAIKVLAGAKLFVGNDGGLLHLANLARTPVVGLYGPVSEVVYGPLESASRTTILTENVPCRHCYRDFRFPPCEHNKQCLDHIEVNRVIESSMSFLM